MDKKYYVRLIRSDCTAVIGKFSVLGKHGGFSSICSSPEEGATPFNSIGDAAIAILSALKYSDGLMYEVVEVTTPCYKVVL